MEDVPPPGMYASIDVRRDAVGAPKIHKIVVV